MIVICINDNWRYVLTHGFVPDKARLPKKGMEYYVEYSDIFNGEAFYFLSGFSRNQSFAAHHFRIKNDVDKQLVAAIEEAFKTQEPCLN